MTSSYPILDILPYEILGIIAQYCSLSDLKILRTYCKRLARASEPWLFETVVLVTQQESFAQLPAISGHPHLSGLVRGLVYDPRSLLHEDHYSVWNAWQTGEIFRAEDNKYRFNSVIRSLPRLERIHIRASGDQSLELPTFYNQVSERRRRRVRLQAVTQELLVSTIMSCIESIDKSIVDLRIDGVRWQVFGHVKGCRMISDETLNHVLSNTRRLEIRLQRNALRMPDEEDLNLAYSRLGTALANKDNIYCLALRFIQDEEWLQEYIRVMAFPSLLPAYLFGTDSQYPNLASLSIETYFTYEQPWLDFLANVTSSLRYLRLVNFGLVAPIGWNNLGVPVINRSETCLTGLLKRMQSILHLNEVDFGGLLVSGGGQRWAITSMRATELMHGALPRLGASESPRNGKLCMKARIAHWFIHGGACPLDAEDNAAPPGSAPIEEGVQPNLMSRGDWSWSLGRLDDDIIRF